MSSRAASSVSEQAHDEAHGHPDALHEDESAVKKDSTSLSVATGVYGVSFGALAIAAGLNTWQTMALSLLLFSGGSQFAVVGVLGAGGTGASAVATSTLLGVRNAIYGLQVNQFLRPRGLRRVIAAQVTIDESAAMSVGRPTERLSRVGFWWTGLGVYLFWNTMTFVGTLAGNAMGDPKKYGLDAAAVGAFMALLWPRLATVQGKLTAALAVVIALGLALGGGLRAALPSRYVPELAVRSRTLDVVGYLLLAVVTFIAFSGVKL